MLICEYAENNLDKTVRKISPSDKSIPPANNKFTWNDVFVILHFIEKSHF